MEGREGEENLNHVFLSLEISVLFSSDKSYRQLHYLDFLGSRVENAQDFTTECVYKGITKYTFCIDYSSQT